MQKNSKPNPNPSPNFPSYYFNKNSRLHSHTHPHSEQQHTQKQQQPQQQQLPKGDHSDNLASFPFNNYYSCTFSPLNTQNNNSNSFHENEAIYSNNPNSPWPSAATVSTPASSPDLSPLVRHRFPNSFHRSCSRLARLDFDSVMASSSSSCSLSTASSSDKTAYPNQATPLSKTLSRAKFDSKDSSVMCCDVVSGSKMLDRTGSLPLPLEFGPSITKSPPGFHRFSARSKSFFSTEIDKDRKRENSRIASNARIEEGSSQRDPTLLQITGNKDNLPVCHEDSWLHSVIASQSADKEDASAVPIGNCDGNNAKEENCATTEQCDDPEVHEGEGYDVDILTQEEDEEDYVDDLPVENEVVYDADDDADADDDLFHDCDDDEWEGNINLTPSRRTPLHRRKLVNSSSPVCNPLQRTRTRSLTDEDLEELRGSIELGFGFDNEENSNLKSTLPALELYYAVNRQYVDSKGRGSPISPLERTSSAGSNASTSTDTWRISSPGDHPLRVKTRLRHWAQVVACSIRQSF